MNINPVEQIGFITSHESFEILMPTRNYGRFISDAVRSICEQDFGNQALIVQDCLSQDDTEALVSEFGTLMRIDFQSIDDSGQSDGLNKAFERASSEFVGWLNADEFYLPGAFSAIDSARNKYPDVDVFYGDCVLVDEEGKIIRLLPGHKFSDFVLRNYGCFISSCTTFSRAKAVSEAGKWDTQIRRSMDWDLWLRMSDNGSKFQYLPVILSAFRVHRDQVTATREDPKSSEAVLMADRHSLRKNFLMNSLGKLAHMFMKMQEGSYWRQLKVSMKYKGKDISKWPLNEEALGYSVELVRELSAFSTN